jgi:hypothetical protein
LRALRLADDPATWERLGFAVGADGVCALGGVALELVGTGQGRGLVGWHIEGVDPSAQLDGLPPAGGAGVGARPGVAHPNGAVAVDHVVAATPDVDRTLGALGAAGLEPRRVRDAGDARQAFYVLRTALLELAGPAAPPSGDGPARLWGLVVVVDDLDALAERLGDELGTIRDAVQPGRRIATLRQTAGVSTALAFLTPRDG